MNKLLTFLAFLGFIAAQAQNRNFSVQGFDKIKIGSAFGVDVRKGSGFQVSAKGNQEDLDDMEAKVENGTLRISYKDQKGWNWGKNRKNVTITITMPALKGVNFSGAVDAKVAGFTSRTFDINVSGASNATINISSDNVRVDCSGASELKLYGDTDLMKADVSGASDLNAMEFKAKNVQVSSSGASDANVYAAESLVANASGASDVRYRGTKNVKKSSSGGSSVKED